MVSLYIEICRTSEEYTTKHKKRGLGLANKFQLNSIDGTSLNILKNLIFYFMKPFCNALHSFNWNQLKVLPLSKNKFKKKPQQSMKFSISVTRGFLLLFNFSSFLPLMSIRPPTERTHNFKKSERKTEILLLAVKTMPSDCFHKGTHLFYPINVRVNSDICVSVCVCFSGCHFYFGNTLSTMPGVGKMCKYKSG